MYTVAAGDLNQMFSLLLVLCVCCSGKVGGEGSEGEGRGRGEGGVWQWEGRRPQVFLVVAVGVVVCLIDCLSNM